MSSNRVLMRQHTTGASKNFSILFKSLYMVYDSKFILMTSECKKISFSPSVISFARRKLAQKCLMFHDKLSSGKRETDEKNAAAFGKHHRHHWHFVVGLVLLLWNRLYGAIRLCSRSLVWKKAHCLMIEPCIFWILSPAISSFFRRIHSVTAIIGPSNPNLTGTCQKIPILSCTFAT